MYYYSKDDSTYMLEGTAGTESFKFRTGLIEYAVPACDRTSSDGIFKVRYKTTIVYSNQMLFFLDKLINIEKSISAGKEDFDIWVLLGNEDDLIIPAEHFSVAIFTRDGIGSFINQDGRLSCPILSIKKRDFAEYVGSSFFNDFWQTGVLLAKRDGSFSINSKFGITDEFGRFPKTLLTISKNAMGQLLEKFYKLPSNGRMSEQDRFYFPKAFFMGGYGMQIADKSDLGDQSVKWLVLKYDKETASRVYPTSHYRIKSFESYHGYHEAMLSLKMLPGDFVERTMKAYPKLDKSDFKINVIYEDNKMAVDICFWKLGEVWSNQYGLYKSGRGLKLIPVIRYTISREKNESELRFSCRKAFYGYDSTREGKKTIYFDLDYARKSLRQYTGRYLKDEKNAVNSADFSCFDSDYAEKIADEDFEFVISDDGFKAVYKKLKDLNVAIDESSVLFEKADELAEMLERKKSQDDRLLNKYDKALDEAEKKNMALFLQEMQRIIAGNKETEGIIPSRIFDKKFIIGQDDERVGLKGAEIIKSFLDDTVQMMKEKGLFVKPVTKQQLYLCVSRISMALDLDDAALDTCGRRIGNLLLERSGNAIERPYDFFEQ